jgi:hypothetical protein
LSRQDSGQKILAVGFWQRKSNGVRERRRDTPHINQAKMLAGRNSGANEEE